MEFVNGGRHLSFESPRRVPVSLERFWDEVAWQRRQLDEGDTLVADPEGRCFTVRYRAGGLPAERSAEVTATGTQTMFLSQHQWGEGTAKVGCGDCGALVRVSRKDPAKLSDGELQDRVVDLAEARARLEGEYLAALGELASRSGAQGAAHRLREMNLLTTAAARSDARLALDLHDNDFGDTIEAMRAGEINVSHARVIAREAPKKHRRSETEFLELCRAYPADVVAKHPFAYQSEEVWADLEAEQAAKSREPADAEYALQRAERKTTLNYGTDGMWHLRGRFDFLTGRRINQALAAAVRGRKQHEDSADHTHAQHAADALAALICGETRSDTKLLILADYDHTADTLGNPRLDDGTPLSAELLAQEALDAEVYCGVFNADWTNLALGRTRNANDAQRLILAARDRGCAGCAAPTETTHAHHQNPHAAGGPTIIENLELLCAPCHTHHHQTHDHHHRPGRPKDHKRSEQPPAPPPDTPTGNPPPPTAADTGSTTLTTRGP
ncbi:MAG: HNH endonuclease signature motif containing protein [bacterium]|nr:HNH endonuclease signature motif containing protein [bacterium]